MSNVYQQMKEAMWGAGLVRGLTGGQKNTGAGAGEGIDSFFVILQIFGLRFAFRFALLAKNTTRILIPPSHPPPSLNTFINYVKSSIDRPYRIQSTPMASIATSNED
jgi:hypothetical protein